MDNQHMLLIVMTGDVTDLIAVQSELLRAANQADCKISKLEIKPKELSK